MIRSIKISHLDSSNEEKLVYTRIRGDHWEKRWNSPLLWQNEGLLNSCKVQIGSKKYIGGGEWEYYNRNNVWVILCSFYELTYRCNNIYFVKYKVKINLILIAYIIFISK